MRRTTFVRRTTLTGAAAAVLVALGATAASAHVTITASTTGAGSTAVLTLEVPHGCDGSPTTQVAVRVPAEVTDVTASDVGRWSVQQTEDGLRYTADEPLTDGEHDEIEFSVRLPDEVGATLVFPVVQECEVGQAAWTEVSDHDGGEDQLDRPAPFVVVTAADPDSESGTDTHEAAETADADDADDAAATETAVAADVESPGASSDSTEGADGAETTASDDSGHPVTYAAAGTLAAGGLVGGAVLLRRRLRG
ncbi:hypothetical protein GCM10025865_12940 [Paraoerskovia sediminicola]|uniref:YncI copper-binding domain-containing protein n=1 Tax=Paraoerskovia sediminicola TaxID=1138587 RepID=A0ABM8G1Q5_9CELL|nr:YcnI family protein [Paraoerskovia sediminicola]BDZ41995.1 hypothetical protein GCM10025865_12940 [Paraoerskovia sediminicola]